MWIDDGGLVVVPNAMVVRLLGCGAAGWCEWCVSGVRSRVKLLGGGTNQTTTYNKPEAWTRRDIHVVAQTFPTATKVPENE